MFDLPFSGGCVAVCCTYSLNKLTTKAMCGGGLRSTVWAEFMEFFDAMSYITNKFNCNWVALYAGWLKFSRWFAGLVIVCCKTYRIFWSSKYCVRVHVFFPHMCHFIVFPLAHRGTQRQNLEYCIDSTVQEILIFFLALEMNCVSCYRFWDDEHENGHKRLDWLQFPKKINKLILCMSCTLCPWHVYWLACLPWLIAPPLCLLFVHKSKGIFLLLSSSLPTPVNSICPNTSSPLLR